MPNTQNSASLLQLKRLRTACTLRSMRRYTDSYTFIDTRPHEISNKEKNKIFMSNLSVYLNFN